MDINTYQELRERQARRPHSNLLGAVCIWPPSTADEAVFHGQSGPCYAAEGR